MFNNRTLHWRHSGHLSKSSINILSWMFCLKWTSHCISHLRPCLWSTIVYIYIYSETCLNWILSKPKTCLNQTDFIVPSIKCLCNLNLCKPSTCLNWTNSLVPKGFCLDRFYFISTSSYSRCEIFNEWYFSYLNIFQTASSVKSLINIYYIELGILHVHCI